MARRIDLSRYKPEQIKAATYLAIPDVHKKTLKEIAEECGVTERTICNWKNDDRFRELVHYLAERYMDDFITEVYAALRHRVVKDKSDKAIELALKRAGKLRDVQEVNATIEDKRDKEALEAKLRELEERAKELTDQDIDVVGGVND